MYLSSTVCNLYVVSNLKISLVVKAFSCIVVNSRTGQEISQLLESSEIPRDARSVVYFSFEESTSYLAMILPSSAGTVLRVWDCTSGLKMCDFELRLDAERTWIVKFCQKYV